MTGRPSTPSSSRLAPRWPERLLIAALVLPLLGASDCGSKDEDTYVQFNADDDTLTIDVGTEDVGEAVSIDLHSTTGSVVIGTATVDPSSGPIGTEHTITVEIFDAYENMVDRVSVRTDSGDRGEDEYDLVGDSADEGFYKLTLVSVGDEGETRQDSFTVRVWDIEDDDDGEPGDTAQDTGSDTGS